VITSIRAQAIYRRVHHGATAGTVGHHLNGRLDALATVTANLYRENQALRGSKTARRWLTC
jgi:hypothetical protein